MVTSTRTDPGPEARPAAWTPLLFRALLTLRPRREPGTCLLYAILAAAAAAVLALPLAPPLQETFLRAHHLRPTHASSWILVQGLPKMYGGAHEAWVHSRPLSPAPQEAAPSLPGTQHLWFNHYPAKVLVFGDFRLPFVLSTTPRHVRLRSSYQDRTLTTVYEAIPAEGGIEVRFRSGSLERAP